MKNLTYADLVTAVETSKLETRYDVVCYCIGFYGLVDKEIFEMINRLYEDHIISA